jgi:hypothetical protein
MTHLVRAFVHHYDDEGRRTAPAKKTFAMLAIGSEPQCLTINIPDKLKTRFRSIQISRKELERVLAQCPQESASE